MGVFDSILNTGFPRCMREMGPKNRPALGNLAFKKTKDDCKLEHRAHVPPKGSAEWALGVH